MILFASLNWYFYLLIAIGGIIVLLALVFLIMFLVSKNAKKKINKEISNLYTNIIDCCGGKSNIKEVSSIGSRLTLTLNDNSKLNEEKLKEINITGIFKTTKKVTLVIGEMASEYAKKIKETLNS